VLILVLAACATLVVGSDSVTAIWQWAARAPEEKLARLGARWNPFTRRFVVPSERTFRRVLSRLDADALDAAAGGWVGDVTRGLAPAPVVPATPARPSGSSGAPSSGPPNTLSRQGCCPAPPLTARRCAGPEGWGAGLPGGRWCATSG
jgi:hypothetical protein